jgi:hypothetical protein
VLFLRAASGPQRTHLDGEGILRLRHWLQQAGITPDHPDAITTQAVRGDRARRLLIHLDHRGARLWWLEGVEVHRAELIPHGLWGCGQRLSHRHDRDIAGQRAPLDHAYLSQLGQAVAEADRVLLVGHGRGQSDLRHLLEEHLRNHQPALLGRLETVAIDDTACTEEQLLALARVHFGNAPHRPPLKIPGQEWREAGNPSATPYGLDNTAD